MSTISGMIGNKQLSVNNRFVREQFPVQMKMILVDIIFSTFEVEQYNMKYLRSPHAAYCGLSLGSGIHWLNT